MNILFEIGHPAHVHFFKNVIWNLEKSGHRVLATAKKKDVALSLLDSYGLKYELVGSNYKGILKKSCGLIRTDYKLLKVARTFKPDLLVGRGSPSLAHLSFLTRKPYIAFVDTEHARLIKLLSHPFADAICVPSCYQSDIDPKKEVRFNGYKELAYLHPDYFTPDPSVLEDLGLSRNDKFIIIRLVSFDASHDARSKGMSRGFLEMAIKSLEEYGRVFITSEENLTGEFERFRIQIPPEKLHSALYYARLCFGDGSTTAVEAALVGTPTVHVEGLKLKSGKVVRITEKLGYLDELANKYEMFHTFTDQKQALNKCLEILQNNNAKKELLENREKLLKDKIDVTMFMVNFIERYPESFHEYLNSKER